MDSNTWILNLPTGDLAGIQHGLYPKVNDTAEGTVENDHYPAPGAIGRNREPGGWSALAQTSALNQAHAEERVGNALLGEVNAALASCETRWAKHLNSPWPVDLKLLAGLIRIRAGVELGGVRKPGRVRH